MTGYIALPKSKLAPLPHSRPAGSIDPAEIAYITVRVRSSGDRAELERKAHELSNQPLGERKYLSREKVAQQYGANTTDLDLIEKLAQQHNLIVVHRSTAQRSIVLKGRLGDLLKAFPADLRIYHHATGTYRGRLGEIKIPQSLDGIITGIFGFDTRPKRRRLHRQQIAAMIGPNGVPATDFARRYNFPTHLDGVALDGSGQTIGIIELGGGFQTSDLQIYFQEIGVPLPSVVAISVDHAGNHPNPLDPKDGEVMLDIEVAGAVAPSAQYAIYFAPNTNQGLLEAIGAAIFDREHQPDVISISWVEPEDFIDQQSLDYYHDLFAAAVLLGVTVCTASGDHGTAVMDAQHWDGKIHVCHPAVDDLVLSCGGTQIDSQNNEIVWNDRTPFDVNVQGGGGWASGGGISKIFALPTYQQNANIPVSIDTGQPGRGIPDISMSATNYFTRVDTLESTSGGTSAVAPLMAALVALLNQAKQTNVGFLNPFLYAHAPDNIVNDITIGTNAITNTVQGYNAGPGWDACTGLGTPDGTAILNTLP